MRQQISQIKEYEELKNELTALVELESQSTDIRELAKLGFKKLLIVQDFCKIDEKLIELSQDKRKVSDYLSEILLFEAKRLAFKEEALNSASQVQETSL